MERIRVKKKTIQTLLEHYQRALPLINADEEQHHYHVATRVPEPEADELCDLLKSRVECPDFLEKLEYAHTSVSQKIAEEVNSWDLISENDLSEGDNVDSDQEDYVLVRQEDIVEGITCFMAAYLLSLTQTKDMTPNDIQDVLSKTFSVKKKKGKLQMAWDGSKVLLNFASWGTTAIGIYRNPVIIRVATKAFLTSCQVISKLL